MTLDVHIGGKKIVDTRNLYHSKVKKKEFDTISTNI